MLKQFDYQLVGEFLGENYEALHTVYSKGCIDFLKKNILKGDFKIINIFDRVSVRKINREEIEKFASPGVLFKNINYVDDLE